jgi:hypothetical protein
MEKQFKNRFQVNDQIVQYHYRDVIRKGTIVKGPFREENIDHYQVKWEWECPIYAKTSDLFKNSDLICDTVSKKYRYELANFNLYSVAEFNRHF